jgi:hypothetical protein
VQDDPPSRRPTQRRDMRTPVVGMHQARAVHDDIGNASQLRQRAPVPLLVKDPLALRVPLLRQPDRLGTDVDPREAAVLDARAVEHLPFVADACAHDEYVARALRGSDRGGEGLKVNGRRGLLELGVNECALLLGHARVQPWVGHLRSRMAAARSRTASAIASAMKIPIVAYPQ